MKLIESNVEYIPQEEGLEGIYEQIERCGRTCYKSSSKYRYWTADKKHFINGGTEDFKMLYSPEEYPFKENISAKDFVDRMIKSQHTAMLEHGTVYLFIPQETNYEAFERYIKNNYSHTFEILLLPKPKGLYVVTNYRVLVENNWLDDLQYLCNPTKFHEKRYTFKFTTDRGVSHQLVRERVMSPAQESQRYCNYLKEKFGMSVTFIQPSWILDSDQAELEEDIKQVESLYFKWLDKGYKPEEARYFLINGTKTEICITGFASDFRYMLDLRLWEKTGKVSPDMLDLMQKAREVMQEASIWDDIMKYPSKFK